MIERLATQPWPDGVDIDDLSFGPISFVHRLQDAPPYDRVVVVGAVARGRAPGEIYAYRWDGVLPDEAAIQDCVCEAVTGVISLDNLLVVGRHFGVLPDDVVVIEVEPVVEDWGEEFTPAVTRALDHVEEMVRAAALAPVAGS